jgi:DNA-binding NarL/FixJ family response regulator
MVKVLVVDDQQLVRDGLAAILQLEDHIEIVGTAGNGKEAYEAVVRHRPEVVLMDIRMPDVGGVDGTRLIKEAFPETKVLILTTFSDNEYILQALEVGASGYLLKEMPSESIASAILTAHSGGVVLQPTVSAQMLAELKRTKRSDLHELKQQALNKLTEREIDVLKLIAVGFSNREIAATLYISEGTVKIHMSNLMSKMHFRDRTQAAIFALRAELVL